MRKKILSLLLAFAMTATVLSTGNVAYAEGDNFSYDEVKNFEEGEVRDGSGEVEEYEPTELQVMDEDGNISYIVDDVDPYVEEGEAVSFFSVAPQSKVVNLRMDNKVLNYKQVVTGKAGYLYGYSGADAAFLSEENGKVKFMISGIIAEANANDVQVVNAVGTSVSYYTVRNGRLLHSISMNLNNDDASSRLGIGKAPSYLAEDEIYYSYDGHYFYDNYEVMLDDYRNNNRNNALNKNAPYYSYFQFLPFRSKTNYTAAELDSVINATVNDSTSVMNNIGQALIDAQNKYGVNALLIAGVAANESNWGKSNIAKTKNNLFGIEAYDSDPDHAKTFESPKACIDRFAGRYISKGYLDAATDARYFGGSLGDKASGVNVKWASDPYWGEKAANIAWSLDKDGKDYGKYNIAIKDTINSNGTNIGVLKDPSSSSKVLYNTKTSSNYPVIVLGQTGDYYKIQTDAILDSTRDKVLIEEEYNFDISYGYIRKNQVTALFGNDANIPDAKPTGHVTSNRFKVDAAKNLISGIDKFPVTVDEFKGQLGMDGSGSNIEVTASGPNGEIGTGSKVVLKDASGNVLQSYDVVVYGDVTGDGIINALDLLRVKKHILGVTKFEGINFLAGDPSGNGVIDALDLLRVQKDILGVKKIAQ